MALVTSFISYRMISPAFLIEKCRNNIRLCFTLDMFECFETGCCTPQSTYFNEGALLPQADMPYQGIGVARVQKGGV